MSLLAPTDIQAALLSLQVAMVATLLALPAGFVVAYLLTFSRLPGKPLIDALVSLPLVLPPVVVGYLLLLLLGHDSLIGRGLDRLGLQILFTPRAAVLASLVVGFPLLVRSVRLAMEAIDPLLLDAARTLGAGSADRLLTLILPLSGRGLLAGASLMFARSLGEFGATILVAGNIPGLTRTIPLAIYDYTSVPGGEAQAAGLCLLAALLALAVLLLNDFLLKQLQRRSRS
ncbi:molybdate ABC transporter permease subunit [Desulfuromonas thiophila]|uniref:Molybdenum transport system permease n=1 Tax=Desulfuromonas thiophila TaxID=57664 RepID=A0A1G6ZWK1_9BACT|nr:molybdate ABC transporter permease subunit [Desulfuromonas thiophila]SDE06763.1 molybdate transport system permease protein [Desulfuromonas thiophila]